MRRLLTFALFLFLASKMNWKSIFSEAASDVLENLGNIQVFFENFLNCKRSVLFIYCKKKNISGNKKILFE